MSMGPRAARRARYEPSWSPPPGGGVGLDDGASAIGVPRGYPGPFVGNWLATGGVKLKLVVPAPPSHGDAPGRSRSQLRVVTACRAFRAPAAKIDRPSVFGARAARSLPVGVT